MAKQAAREFDNAVVGPIYQNAVFHFADSEQVIAYHEGRFDAGRYGRYDNPSWLEVERTLAQLDESEEALVFPSGMNAIAMLALTFLRRGDQIIFTELGYRNIRRLFTDVLEPFGIDAVGINQSDIDSFNEAFVAACSDRTRMVYIEMPSNPHLYLVDLDEIVRAVSPSTLLVVDSTFATPVNFKPRRFGADLVVHSATKYLGGHADLMAGSVSGSGSLISELRSRRDVVGSIVSPQTAFLLNRSLATLPVRMAHLNASGQSIAEYLSGHPRVKSVFYTGLQTHPHGQLAQRYLTGHGSVVSFELDASYEDTSQFVDALRLPLMGTNFGSQHSMVEQVALFSYFKQSPEERAALGISDSLVRLSLGLDDVGAMIADIDQALGFIT